MQLHSTPRRPFFDGLAIGLSGLCLVHCVALPLMLIALPNLSVARHWPEEIHIIAATLAVFACGAAIIPRWPSLEPRQQRFIGLCALIGLAGLLGGLMVHHHVFETALTVVGSVFLIAAHSQNLRA